MLFFTRGSYAPSSVSQHRAPSTWIPRRFGVLDGNEYPAAVAAAYHDRRRSQPAPAPDPRKRMPLDAGSKQKALAQGRTVSKILRTSQLAPDIYEMVIDAPRIAAKAQPGHFVIVMAQERGERIPLTIADYDRPEGTITFVVMIAGTSTSKLVRLKQGQDLYALIGPLGNPSDIDDYGTVVAVAGGVGTAPVYPIARTLREKGNRLICIQGARTKNLLFWQDKLAAVSDQHIITTDDGSFGIKGLVTDPLKQLLQHDTDKKIGCVYAIGPAVMMKFCSKTTQPFAVRTMLMSAAVPSLPASMVPNSTGTRSIGTC